MAQSIERDKVRRQTLEVIGQLTLICDHLTSDLYSIDQSMLDDTFVLFRELLVAAKEKLNKPRNEADYGRPMTPEKAKAERPGAHRQVAGGGTVNAR